MTPNDDHGGERPADYDKETKFDEVGRRAGAALRRPAPAGGIDDIARRSQQRRVAVVAVSAIMAIAVVGAVAFLRADRSNTGPAQSTTVPSSPTTSPTSVATSTTAASTTTPATTAPLAPTTFTPTATATPTFAGGPIQTVTFSPDGNTIVARLGGAVSVFDARSGEERAFFEYSSFDNPLDGRISSNEAQLVISPDGSLRFDGNNLVDTSTGEVAVRLDLTPLSRELTIPRPRSPQFSSDGSTFAVMTRDNEISLYDTATGSVRRLDLTDATAPVAWVVMSSDFRRLRTIELQDAAPRAHWSAVWGVDPLERLMAFDPYVELSCFSPDSELVVRQASGDSPVEAAILDSSTGSVVATLEPGFDSCEGFSPDGNKILVDGSVVYDAKTGAVLSTFLRPVGDITAAALSPDGGRIVLTSPEAGNIASVWDTTTGQKVADLTGHTAQVVSASFSPDGSTIVTASVDGTVRLWPAP